MWERGLKLYERGVMFHVNIVVPSVGTWIEIRYHQSGQSLGYSRSQCGNVD